MTFNPINFGSGDGANGIVWTSITQPDGKIIIGGNFSTYNGTVAQKIARINADGSLDTSFNSGFAASTTTTVNALALQSDGKIIIAGSFTSYNGTTRNRIARLNADGTLDTSFNPGSGANSKIGMVSLQSDGKIIIGGTFTNYNGTTRNRIARINQNGSLDTSFSPGTGVNGEVYAIAIQSDGKILIGGTFTTFNSLTRNRIVRINTNGTLDNTFSIGTGASNTVLSIAIQDDGKVIITGWFTSYAGVSRNYIARINSNGTIDTNFSSLGTNSAIRKVTVLSNGKILVVGQFSLANNVDRNGIAMLQDNGILDSNFNPGAGVNNSIYTSAILNDGKIMIGGEFSLYNNYERKNMAKINSDFSIDNTFNPTIGPNQNIYSLLIQPNGKIIIAGDYTSYADVSSTRITRLNTNGTIDPSFNAGAGPNNGIFVTTLQDDGKILIGGWFTAFNGTAIKAIARLNSNGTLDNTFNPGTSASSDIYSITLQSDGKIIICGEFTSFNGTPRNRIARLNANGTIDLSFNPGTGANQRIEAAVLQPDGKIIIGGLFTSYNNITINRIARLNADGSLDTSFSPGAGANNNIQALALQPDGKVLVAGKFTTFNSSSRNRIVRLNTNGSLDNSFNIGTGTDNGIKTIAIQDDGKVIIGGEFTSYNGNLTNRLARLNVNGAFDETYNTGNGANDFVWTCNLQANGKLIIGGFFTYFDGTFRNRIARIYGDTNCDSFEGIDTINSCDPITWIDGITYTTSNNIATHLLVGAGQNGCDSLVTLNLTIETSASSLNATIAQGQSYLFDNQNLTTAGSYSMTLQNAAGCDSVVTLNLTVVEPLNYALNASNNEICLGDEVTLTVYLEPQYPAGYVHCNGIPTAAVDVTNPATGKTWMDRNLGANRAAISSTDAESYGSLFQWGRFADGHQCVNRYAGDGVTTSANTAVNATVSTDTPPHSDFILRNSGTFDWRTTTNNNLWQGVSGINNPCPGGYRLPTYAELIEESSTWTPSNASGAFASVLKMPIAGKRDLSTGLVSNLEIEALYWSSTPGSTSAGRLRIDTTSVGEGTSGRSWGHSIRCIKN